MTLRFALTVALAGLCACGEAKHAADLDFAAYGDARNRPDVHRKIVQAIRAAKPKFVLATGDLVEYGKDSALWTEVAEILKDLRATTPYYCCYGDHDEDEKNQFEKLMGMERPYFDKREGDFHLFILDSRARFSEGPQMDWFRKTAEASTAKHKIAVLHHTPFFIHERRMGSTDDVRSGIHPLLLKYKFCGVMAGHQHAFYTTQRDGLRYVVTAGGGAPLHKIDASLGIAGDKSRKFFHFVGFKIAGPTIEGHVYDENGVEDESLAFPLCSH